ncbi:hypothetical protein ACSFA3_01960 [Variovorax sp. RHLX14]|uniref:hypothetical protein n=1 Tax=Variovorax sp. RHLX14 TaxID=1259731 RepID=UPI003F4541FD
MENEASPTAHAASRRQGLSARASNVATSSTQEEQRVNSIIYIVGLVVVVVAVLSFFGLR